MRSSAHASPAKRTPTLLSPVFSVAVGEKEQIEEEEEKENDLTLGLSLLPPDLFPCLLYTSDAADD